MSTQHSSQSTPSETFFLEVSNVTGTRFLEATEVDPTTPADMLARALADKMSLPENVPWALRNDDSAEFLNGKTDIGSQVKSGAHVSLTPKAHLG